MPTGYTSIIDDKGSACTFEDYVWRCARASGALIMMRDEPLDAPITDEAFSTNLKYYSEELTREEARLAELRSLTHEEIERRSQSDHEEAMKRYLAGREERDALRANYSRIREEVTAWEPPGPDHARLKEFMLEQLNTGGPGNWEPIAPVRLSPLEWHRAEVASTEERIARVQQMIAEEKSRAASRRAWVEELRKSVPQPGAKEQP